MGWVLLSAELEFNLPGKLSDGVDIVKFPGLGANPAVTAPRGPKTDKYRKTAIAIT
jgi:hypothetical protein